MCIYRQKLDSYTASHTASAVIDVCLLPEIAITTLPQFPLCGKSDFVEVTGRCEIKKSNERYVVTWEDEHISASIISSEPKSEYIVLCLIFV